MHDYETKELVLTVYWQKEIHEGVGEIHTLRTSWGLILGCCRVYSEKWNGMVATDTDIYMITVTRTKRLDYAKKMVERKLKAIKITRSDYLD